MLFLDLLAEQKLAEAERDGLLRDLPGAGRPLDLDGDPLIPEDLRMAYRILKNAGFVPPEVTTLREVGELEALVRREAGEARDRAQRRLALLRAQLDASGPGRAAHLVGEDYFQRVVDRMAGDPRQGRD
jgi:hypothetical protein